MANVVKLIGALAATVALIVALNRSWGVVPPFGPLLSPFTGFWQNAETATRTANQTLNVVGVRQPVSVIFDDQMVPHVFARTNYDAYFVQGYLTARDRLWQMEFQTHAAAGRLSEVVGERAVELDRHTRRMGTGYGAEQALKAIMADARSRETVAAYTAGVNAWIDQLTPATYPIEYKLLGYAPESWTMLKCALLLKQMTTTLAAGADDLEMTNVLRQYGPAVTADLFPDYPSREDPIIPTNTKLTFTPLPVPRPPATTLRPGDSASLTNRATLPLRWPDHDPSIGSNNWAVGPQKSATGYPILANDPHLQLSLPSIWYQIQLVSPDMNVYGATLPGAPGVIIGFNQRVAWGVTNVGGDVLDFYRIRFQDSTRRAYWHDGRWKPVRRRVEVLRVKGRPNVVDTVLYTHHGPVVYTPGQKPFRNEVPVGHAIRWIAHEPSNELLCFYYLNRAGHYNDYVRALAHYAAPAQNFVFAAADGDIAISPNGRFPLKYPKQGKFLLDGSNPAHDWQGWIPPDQNPRVRNPARGFVSSANQFPASPTTYPYYLGWEFAPAERGIRINQRLTAMARATPDSLRGLQNDNFNVRAATVLPNWLPQLRSEALTPAQQTALQLLRGWRYNNDADAIGATIFAEWSRRLMDVVWGERFNSTDTLPLRYPSFDRTQRLIRESSASPWFDNPKTPTRETATDALTYSFRVAVDTLQQRHGALGPAWAWAQHKSTAIRHLVPGLDAFSALNVVTGGGPNIVNATGERNGPSWRMVVALGPQPRALGVYPGGQSGNPGSPYYLNTLETWRTGQLNELLYLTTATDTHRRIRARWQIDPTP